VLDRSQTPNLFTEHAQEADDLPAAADAAVEHPAASPDADPVEARCDASPSTTAPPRTRPRRPRPNGGGRRGAVRSKPRVAARKPALSLPAVPLRVRGWSRRVRPFAPVAVLLLILAADPAGCDRRATRTRTTTSSAPTAAPHPHQRTGTDHSPRPGRLWRAPHIHPGATTDATATAPAPERLAPPAAATAPQPTPAAPATLAARTVAIPASRPVAPYSGSPRRRERGEGDEFGFER